MALSADGLGRQLTGLPENYAFVSAQVPVADADAAAARAVDSLHLTNDFSGLFYQDTSVDEVHWITDLDATQQAAKDAFVAEYGSSLAPATTAPSGDG